MYLGYLSEAFQWLRAEMKPAVLQKPSRKILLQEDETLISFTSRGHPCANIKFKIFSPQYTTFLCIPRSLVCSPPHKKRNLRCPSFTNFPDISFAPLKWSQHWDKNLLGFYKCRLILHGN